MTSVTDDGCPAIRDRPNHKRKRSLSRSFSPPTAAGRGSNSPQGEIRSKRSRLQNLSDIPTFTARSPSVEAKTPTIIESAISELRLNAQNRLDKLKERLGSWEQNDFVNLGYDIPPIADPHLYFLFTNIDFGSHIDEKRQREEFIGDRIYGACLVEVLERWRLPRRCISLFYSVFASNVYQERLFRKWKLPEFRVERSREMLPGKPCADALEVYCSLASRDPLYEFCQVRFQEKFCAVLQHALLPLLEYAAELYEPPPKVFNGKLPSMADHKLDYKTEKHYIGSDPNLNHILHACGDKKGDEKGDKKKKELDAVGGLWKVTVTFSIPPLKDHEFWRKPSVNGTYKTAEENSTPLQVFAFASSEQEALSLAVMKLMNVIRLLREIWRKRRETEDMKLTISKLISPTIRPIFANMTDDMALNIGAQLFKFYLDQQYGTRMRDQVWHSMTTLIGEASKECSAELQSLLKYYLIYPMIRQERLIDAIQHITSLQKEHPSSILSDLFLTRLEELEQLLHLNGRASPLFLQNEVFAWLSVS